MLKHIKQWFKNHIDYHIIGEYYDCRTDNKGNKIYVKKYNKKYYFKK